MNCFQRSTNFRVLDQLVAVDWRECAIEPTRNVTLALVELPRALDELHLSDNLHPDDRSAALKVPDGVERQHFMARRIAQNWFVSSLAGCPKEKQQFAIARTASGAPYSPLLPGWALSFSATATHALLAASPDFDLGVDIESLRQVQNAPALARRFFSKEEAEDIANLGEQMQSERFLRYWSAKEACTKLAGQGMVLGPERVVLQVVESGLKLRRVPEELGEISNWQLFTLDFGPAFVATLALRTRQYTVDKNQISCRESDSLN